MTKKRKRPGRTKIDPNVVELLPIEHPAGGTMRLGRTRKRIERDTLVQLETDEHGRVWVRVCPEDTLRERY
ncbi:hypothetical protein [Crateriforma conspicua]|uniref:hypothetical protein n=1 Tax=Crateriforma conspicua TaxID=2527996 RepID=UPI001188A12B|nr:hypothetical protein [Crateriforma conspicua]QDV66207.1 hypothetical protein Mal65_53820 [Crateriforma conspicua]